MRFRKIPESAQRNISGLRVREARLSSDPPMTQARLAAALTDLGIVMDRVAVAKIETGPRCVFDFELKAFAAALNRPVEWLLGIGPRGTSGSVGVARGNK